MSLGHLPCESNDLGLVDADLSILDCIFTKENVPVTLHKDQRGLNNLTIDHALLALLLLHRSCCLW